VSAISRISAGGEFVSRTNHCLADMPVSAHLAELTGRENPEKNFRDIG
jgi:hypothetical protein